MVTLEVAFAVCIRWVCLVLRLLTVIMGRGDREVRVVKFLMFSMGGVPSPETAGKMGFTFRQLIREVLMVWSRLPPEMDSFSTPLGLTTDSMDGIGRLSRLTRMLLVLSVRVRLTWPPMTKGTLWEVRKLCTGKVLWQ